MQVVYSGGTSTPSPSPRLPRKSYGSDFPGYGRPFMPGYPTGTSPKFYGRALRPSASHINHEGSVTLKDYIPAMRKPLALLCLLFNIVIPGFGTLVSGFTVLCGSKPRPDNCSKGYSIWVNCGVAGLQFLTTFIFLLGWIWSIIWALSFHTVSNDYFSKTQDRDKKDEKQKPEKSPEPHPLANGANTSTTVNRADSYGQLESIDDSPQPIIVLHPTSTTLANGSSSSGGNSGPIMTAATRQHKLLRRQMSDNNLSPFTLTEERLQKIVLHQSDNQTEAGPS